MNTMEYVACTDELTENYHPAQVSHQLYRAFQHLSAYCYWQFTTLLLCFSLTAAALSHSYKIDFLWKSPWNRLYTIWSTWNDKKVKFRKAKKVELLAPKRTDFVLQSWWGPKRRRWKRRKERWISDFTANEWKLCSVYWIIKCTTVC